ncbi:MAG: DUF167 family protein [Xanthobacteraceae bacterium]
MTVWRAADGGIDLAIRLTPKGGADRIEGIEQGADGRSYLKARVRAVPEKGAANRALEKLLAGWLGVPAGTVCVVAGGTSRLKTVRIQGDAEALGARVELLFAQR